MKTVKLVHGNTYCYQTTFFNVGVAQDVSDELATILLNEGYEHYDADIGQVLSFKYFEEVKPATKETKAEAKAKEAS